jgi:alpha-L-fucosidase
MSRYISKSAIAIVITALSFSSTTARASHIGGGDQNPNLETDAKAIAKWQDAKIGLTMHWGPVALRGTEIGWSRAGTVALPGTELIGWSSSEQVPAPDYDALYKEFNPVLFDAEEWAQLLKDSGFRYVALVSKHHDGFVMWDTKQTDYNIMNSAFHRDWLKEISDACRKQGIMFGVYYSILDFYQYDYAGGTQAGSTLNRGGPGFKLDRPPDFERYVSYMKAELKELIQNYGIEDLVLDGNWDPSWTHERGGELYRYLRSLKNDLLVSNRVDAKAGDEEARAGGYEKSLWVFYSKPWNPAVYAGDYLDREEYIGGPAPYPWEAWITMGEQWAWRPNDKYKSPEEIIRYMVETVGGGGNFNLNVTPMPDGRFEQRQKDALLKIGAWLKANGESIYGTRAGPFEPGLWGASSRRGDKVYVHILFWPGETLRLPPLDQAVKSARRLNGGEVRWKQAANGVEISLPESQRDPLDTIVELTVGR